MCLKHGEVLYKMRMFIMCPAEYATGGTELLHQFSRALSDRGVENYMVYFNRRETECPTPPSFYKYDVKYVTEYIDSEESVLVLPETLIHFCDLCKKGKLIIWWLSVDNYIRTYHKYFSTNNYDCFRLKNRENVMHLVQSEYAKHFLYDILNVKICYWLTDYINDAIINVSNANIGIEKENIVLYNPKKGYETLEPIISASNDKIRWIPLTGMQPNEVAELMCHAKLYVDFGNHPGKDRIPREAAICGCCILTNRKGSAAYQEDVKIPDKYKVSDTSNISDVLTLIYDMLSNYESINCEFQAYRERILVEKNMFENEVDELIGRIGIEDDSIVSEQSSDFTTLIVKAANGIKNVAEKAKKDEQNGNYSKVINDLLIIDHTVQVLRETIYATFQEITKE